MDLLTVMDEVGDRLDTIDGLRVHRFPPDSLVPPAAIVAWPDTYDPHGTYNRGMSRLSLPVVVVVGRQSDRAARENLGTYCADTGSSSVIAVLESGGWTSFDVATVRDIEFDPVRIGGQDYVAALFDVDIVGDGAV